MHRDQVKILGHLLLDIFGCMGCFFGCFRVRDGDRRQPPLVSDHLSSKAKDPLASKNRLASLLLEDQGSIVEHRKSHDLQTVMINEGQSFDEQELRDEAKFLKSCGTILQTPAEIRKQSEMEKLEVGDDGSSKFHSWLPGTACKKLNWDELQSQGSHSPYKLKEKENEASVQEKPALPEEKSRSMPELQKIGSCRGDFPSRSELKYPQVDIQNGKNNELISSEPPASRTQCKIKSVRFEDDNIDSMDFVSTRDTPFRKEAQQETESKTPGTDDGKHEQVGHRFSPYPTPLRLTDDMQTPGTVYPVKTVSSAMGKNPRVRSIYVYPVLNPVENISQWTALKEDSDTFNRVHSSGEIPNLNNLSTCKDREQATECLAIPDHQSSLPVEASLSHWVKPLSKEDVSTKLATPKGTSDSGQSTNSDRPIIGLVATHWNDEELTQLPPKEWDGNGIPNSTTKYKEDQKVNWHATPFEERLEKALSDERLLPRKLHTGTPIYFEESEESDTATSFLSTPARRTVHH